MNSRAGSSVKLTGIGVAVVLVVAGSIGAALMRMRATPHFPVLCDITQTAAQSPEFVQHYFDTKFYGQRNPTYSTENILFGDRFASLKCLSYYPSPMMPGERNDQGDPYVEVVFSRGKTVRATVVFKQHQSVRETARRVGLDLSAFHYQGTTFHGYQLHYSGVYRGVVIKDLMLTNPAEDVDAPRVINITFDTPDAAKSKPSAI